MATKLVTSIDIGFSSVKVAQFEVEDGELKLVNASMAVYPRQQAGQPPVEVITDTLRSLIEDNKLRVKSAYLTIPRSQVTSKRLSNFPNNASVEQVRSVVSIQAEAELPFGASQIVYDYQIVQHEPTQVLVDLVGARLQLVNQYLGILTSLDIEIDGIVPSTGALGFLARTAPSQTTGETLPARRAPLLVVDIGAGHTDLVLIRGRRVYFSRSFPVAGDRLTQAYATANGVPFQDAEQIKLEQAALPEEPDPADVTTRWATNLVREMELSIQASAQETIGDVLTQPDEVWICGGASQLPGLADFVAQRLGASIAPQPRVQIWNPLDRFVGQDGTSPTGPSMARAIGLGAQAASGEVIFSLIPKAVKQQRAREHQQRRILMYAASAFVVLVALVWAIGSWVSSRMHERTEIEDELGRLQSSFVAVEKDVRRDLVLVDMLEPRLSVLDVLLELSDKLPPRKEIAVKVFNLAGIDKTGKGTLILQVEANSHEDISKALTILGNSPLFDSVRSGQVTSTEKDKRPIFTTQINCVLAADADEWIAKRKRMMKQEEFQLASLPPVQQETKPEDGSEAVQDNFMPMMQDAFMPLLLDDQPEADPSGAEPESDSPEPQINKAPDDGSGEPEQPTIPAKDAQADDGVTSYRVDDSAVSEIQVETGENP